MKKILRRILKILGWTAAGLIALIILLLVAIQLPAVQNFARGKVVAWLEKKLGTDVEVGRLSITFPKKVVLENVYFEDQKKDTLFAGGRLAVDLDMFAIIRGKVQLNSIEFEGIYANIYRKGQDSFFNYDYIVKAFTSPSISPQQADTSGVEIDISHIDLKNIRANYRDDASGDDYRLSLGSFNTRIKKFDLNHMKFELDKIELNDVYAKAYRHIPLAAPKEHDLVPDSVTESETIGIVVGPLSLRNIQVDYEDDQQKMTALLRLGELELETENLDLDKMKFEIERLELKNTTAVIHQFKNTDLITTSTTVADDSSAVDSSWAVQLAKLNIQNVNLKYDDDNAPLSKGMDFAHLKVDNLKLQLEDGSFTPEFYTADVLEASMKEQSGFELQELRTKFAYSEKGIQLRELFLKTENTLLKDELLVGWPSLASLSKDPGSMLLNAKLDHSYIGFRDILYFVPDLSATAPFNSAPDGRIAVNGSLNGYLNNLNIPLLEVQALQHTSLRIRGRIIGMPDFMHGQYNLAIDELRTTSVDLQKLVPKGTIPTSVQIPEMIRLKGTFVGNMDRFQTHLMLSSTRGNAVVQASMAPGYRYNVQAGLQNLDLKYILQNQDLGLVTARATANGAGIDPKTMVAKAKVIVDAADYNGYTYRNLYLDATANKGAIAAQSIMRDPNISFSLDANALMKGTYPALKMDMQIDSVDLRKLGFYNDEFRVHGHITADMPSTDPDALLGTVDLSHIVLSLDGKRHSHPDTIRIVAAEDSGRSRSITVYSDVIQARLAGQYKLTEIATAVQHTINRYYHIPGFKDTAFTPQQWTLNAKIHPTPLLHGFVPAMRGSDSMTASVVFSSAAESLNMNLDAPLILYNDSRIDSLKVRVSTTDSLNYAISLQRAQSGAFQVYQTSLSGAAVNNALNTNLVVNDRSGNMQYSVSGNINQPDPGAYRITLAPDPMLDYERWQVPVDNFISYDPRGIVIHNFSISNGGQSLNAASQGDTPGAPIDINFKQFRISTITRIARQQDILADGIINGDIHLRNPTGDLQLTSDIKIQDLSYRGDTLGNLSVQLNREAADQFATVVELHGHGNDLKMEGTYTTSTEAVNMDLEIQRFSLGVLPSFSAGQLQEAGGTLRGSFGVKGTLNSPSVAGEVRFDSAYLRATLLGEKFTFTDETINIDAEGVHFNHFTLVDSSQNKAEIDGDVLTDDFRNYRFAMNITADNFRAVNSTRGITHKPFYGRLNVSTNTKIRGGMNMPEVNSYVRINRLTDFSYVLPANDPEVQSRQGVVEFVDFSEGVDSSIFKYVGDSAANAGVTGMNLSATIETDSGANFNIVLDERNGDAIHIRGIAALQADIDRSGKISLTGAYTLNEGSYLLTLNFLRRQFYIKPGSTIIWDGDPLLANVDITAIYLANTAPIDLVQHQLAGRSQYEINQYKQRVPFNVLLKMKGDLQHPQISFDIEMNERDASRYKEVDAKLAQIRADESEMNKQVFALLLLGHFVDENPLAGSSTPTTAESFARESASRILTDQLNRIAGNMVKGVDLTFGVNSGNDYSTGDLAQRTDLSVGVSKRLMNDRLKVNVGSTFGIEGPTAPNQQASNIAGNASVDYVLTKDGRYVGRAYYRNDYQGQVEGQVQETGATLIFRIDYDNLSEFFRKPKSKKPNTTVR